jgi:hypothetical protein
MPNVKMPDGKVDQKEPHAEIASEPYATISHGFLKNSPNPIV